MNKYTAIIPSKDLWSVVKCIEAISNNSLYCDEIIVIWNGIDPWSKNDWQINGKKIVIVVPEVREVYSMFNLGVEKATNTHCLLINDDMYVSQGFDQAWAFVDEEPEISNTSIVTWQVVEPGFVDVHQKNLEMDFGRDWKSFQESQFVEFAKFYQSDKPDIEPGLGWYMPVLFPKALFIKEGMYPTDPPFPHHNDIIFFEKLQAYRFFKINMLVYHFQRLSQRVDVPLTKKLNLACGTDRKEGYVNVDKEDFDLTNGIIPFAFEQFEEVLFKHALEHLRFDIGKQVLNEVYRVLKTGGLLQLHVPDLEVACEDFLKGYNKYGISSAPAISRIYGLNTSEEQVHKSGYTKESLINLLEGCGFHNVTRVETDIPDEICMKGYK